MIPTTSQMMSPTSNVNNRRQNRTPNVSQRSQSASVHERLGAAVIRDPSMSSGSRFGSNACASVITTRHEGDSDDECLNLAILPSLYPTESWTETQLEAVQQSIIDLIRSQNDSRRKPAFSGCVFRQGWLLVSCSDAFTVNWLKSVETQLRPWDGASLQVKHESEVKTKQKFAGLFPALETTTCKYVLRVIAELNSDLNVHEWLVIFRSQMGPQVKLVIAIDSYSAEVLRNRGYRLNYGFDVIRFRPINVQ